MTLSINNERILAMLNVTAEIIRTDEAAKIYDVTRAVQTLGKIAKSLHKRYENACNYQWACTEKYEAATSRLESKAEKIAKDLKISIGFQRDPRGWPIVIRTGGYETRLG